MSPEPGPCPVWRGVIGEFAASLPEIAVDAVVTLGEGGTPLLPAPRCRS